MVVHVAHISDIPLSHILFSEEYATHGSYRLLIQIEFYIDKHLT